MSILFEINQIWESTLHGYPLWPATFIGIFLIVSTLCRLICGIYRNLKTRLFPFNNFKGLGKWAVVTGSSDGIGQAYAEQLAAKGMSVVLVSRTEAKLIAVAEGIKKDFPNVDVKWITADFSNLDVYDNIEKQLEGLDIGVLVNNVGVACDDIQFFHETTRQFVKKQINVNIYAVTMMTHIVLPSMVKKNRGLIVNVASVAGQLDPYLAVMYGSAKRYMKHFTYGLQLECASQCPGVIVQDMAPWFVATNMAHAKGKRFPTIPTPHQFVSHAIRTIGLPFTHGHLEHEIEGFIIHCLPNVIVKYGVILVATGLRKLAIHNKRKAQAALKKE